MILKKWIVPVLAISAMMTGCSSDEPEVKSHPSAFEINLSLADLTRAGSDEGGIANMEGKSLVFTLAVVGGKNNSVVVYAGQQTAVVTNGEVSPVSFTPSLVPGENYSLVAYANFSGTNELALPDSPTPSDYLKAMQAVECDYTANNEGCDSYYAVQSFDSANQSSIGVTLIRACAKMRVVNTGSALSSDATVEATLENVYSLTNTFDVLTGDFSLTTPTTATLGPVDLPTVYTDSNQTLMTVYLPIGTEEININVTVTVKDGEKTVVKTLEVPLKRNTLTTLSGNFSN